jgi:hypothetical protein
MKAGDAIIYDHRLIHGSPPNMTNVIRMAVNMVYIPVVSSPIHYVYDSNKIRMFEVDNEFFHTCNTKDESALDRYQFLEEIEVSRSHLQQKELNDLILGNN